MLSFKNSAPFTEIDSPREGSGTLFKWDLITKSLPCKNLKWMSYLELLPHSSIGKHQHVGDFECYFIIEGNAVVSDNHEEKEVSTGDLLVTKDQEFHAISNNSDKVVKILAFICETHA